MFDLTCKYSCVLLLVSALLNFGLAVFLVLLSRSRTGMVLSFVCLLTGLWTAGMAAMGLFALEQTICLNNILAFITVLIPASFLHFTFLLCGNKRKTGKAIAVYLPSLVVAIALFIYPHALASGVIKQSAWIGMMVAWLYLIYVLYFSWLALTRLIKTSKTALGIIRERARLILIAAFSSLVLGGCLNIVQSLHGNFHYGLAGPYCLTFLCYAMAVAVCHRKLIDIQIVLARVGIFIMVYSLVLGIPYLLSLDYPRQNFIALTLMAVLASLGPFVYLYLRKKTEGRILLDQRGYQSALIQASAGMVRVKDMNRLLKLIVRFVTRVVKVEHSAVYIYDNNQAAYVLGQSLGSRKNVVFPEVIPADAYVIEQMIGSKKIVVAEECRIAKSALCIDLAALHAALVVPSIMDQRLVCFFVLGAKISGQQFCAEELSVFGVLANQSALAIENALFYEGVKRSQEQLFKAEKMATIGTMADGLSHQINNRFHVMGFIAGDMHDTLAQQKMLFVSPELQRMEVDLNYGLARLQENVIQGGAIVQGLMKYTCKGEEGFTACDINKVFDSAYEMVQYKIKKGQIRVEKDYDVAGLPMVRGNFTQLLEVFFNLIDNAYDATMQRKKDLAEAGYMPSLRVCITAYKDKVNIALIDNGIGVKDEDKRKFFTPFFTTKATSRKGTGLGLYVMRKIIEENHDGHVDFESKYKSGTKMLLVLPAVQD